MKKILFSVILAFAVSMAYGQTNVIKTGNNLSPVHSVSVSDTSITRNSHLTTLTFSVNDSTTLNVWESTGGSFYVVRKSKKTGQQYRQYLKITN